MEIEKLIENLSDAADWADKSSWDSPVDLGDNLRKAVETIRLLWEVAKDNTNEKYKRKIDENAGTVVVQ